MYTLTFTFLQRPESNGLHCNYAKQTIVTVSVREHIICSWRRLVNLNPPSLWLVTSTISKQFHLPNFTHKAWINLQCSFLELLCSVRCLDCFPRLILSSHYLDKSTLVRFEFLSLDWNAILTMCPLKLYVTISLILAINLWKK